MENHYKTFISGLVGYAVQRNLSAEKLLGTANISIEELTDLQTPLTAKQVDDVWLNAISMSKDNLFGLHFGESLQLQALGVVGEIIKTSKTVGEAITTAAALVHLITASVELKVIRENDHFFVEFLPVNTGWQQEIIDLNIVDLLMVFVIHELDGLMFKKLFPISVSFARSLDSPEEYERVLRCKPEVNANSNRITFDGAYWEERIITSNHEHQKVLLAQAGLWQSGQVHNQPMRERVYSYIKSNSYLKMTTLEDIACNFNISPRTLQRKLQDEGINFQQLADEARKNLALTYLKDESFQVKEIAYMLGYNDVSAFVRAFKKWTGMAPIAYQKTFLQVDFEISQKQ